MSDTIITIPNHHDNLDFLKEWKQLQNTSIIIMQDTDVKVKNPGGFTDLTIVNHQDVEKELGKDAWIIPKGTSACRSFAYYKAWQRHPKNIITLDNDCFPDASDDEDFVQRHSERLDNKVTLDWFPSNYQFEYTRGFPYLLRDTSHVVLNHGLWSKVPDFDAATHLTKFQLFRPTTSSHIIPRYNFFPMCGMNLSWAAEFTPAMYFGLFGPDYGFDQFDDIWAGVIVKKIIDHLAYAATSGYPSVEHRKQSNVFVNMRKQAPGMQMNEDFWKVVQDIKLTENTVIDCYEELITQLPTTFDTEPEGWTRKFKKAALIWIKLFKDK